jgi:pantothenate kinase-related protein Tda10
MASVIGTCPAVKGSFSAKTSKGMNDEEVKAFVDYFWKA